eukprot:CAMPEP_0168590656 /NCGR_PEP_ID=MMETSP0420-20121227/6687_1 /TAXON_ID=498008 /ORGANISM="Pessonella sp." /LENGTH=460 /DNA_ID=CAMNT_0008626335 /DNA_START=43 /DNA_END=1422 /DNA_ORIENTATION=-
MSKADRTLTITDSETGESIEVPVKNGTIAATELSKLGVRSYDPAFFNTAICSSKITYIDGDNGILRYRGYDIEQLAEKSTFLEVAFLLIHGHLPNKSESETWNTTIMSHTFVHENLTQLMKTFRYDAHPMGMVISSVAALSTFYPDANPTLNQGKDIYKDPKMINKQMFRIIGKLPTIAACAYRHRIGRPYNLPVNHLSYTGNFLYMMDRLSESNYVPDPRLAKALDVMFILHADHELNCSTAAMRHVASAGTDPVTAVAAAASALYGPLHGGANEAALRMLKRIGTPENVPAFVEKVKNKEELLMGFGHRVYKNYDPRARIIKQVAHEVFEICGRDALVDVALKLEEVALHDSYFIERKLYPNVDFYSGLIYSALGFPTDMFPVLFTIPRTVGWLAHWYESLGDNGKIFRPRQIYNGEPQRDFVPMHMRPETAEGSRLAYRSTGTSKRNKTTPAKTFLG